MKNVTKILVDIGPLAVFFIFYKITGNILEAIIPLIIATTISILISYIIEKKIPLMPTIGGLIVIIFGGMTIYFENKIFFYMKPTIINILFASVLIIGNYLKKPFLKYLSGDVIQLTDIGWYELAKRWSIFFIILAFINEIIWRFFTEEFWVNFKVFGILGLTLIFSITLYPIIQKYQKKN